MKCLLWWLLSHHKTWLYEYSITLVLWTVEISIDRVLLIALSCVGSNFLLTETLGEISLCHHRILLSSVLLLKLTTHEYCWRRWRTSKKTNANSGAKKMKGEKPNLFMEISANSWKACWSVCTFVCFTVVLALQSMSIWKWQY